MKDPYEVLGVRRNAGAAEIELAYKGRRTQYHPDKYQGSDAQTLRWATQQMQEVNAAYAVLSDAKERARFDAQWQQPQGKMPVEDPPRGHAPSAGTALSLRELLNRQLAPYAGFSRT
jgi:curved DNA-binding protein CbpA